MKLLLVLAVACTATDSSELPTPARYTYLRVATRTSGGDVDLDGYEVLVDGLSRAILGSATPATLPVQPGTHSVTLQGVAGNCTVDGAATKDVTVEAGKIVDVPFDIVCAGTGFTITTATEGSDTPDSIQVLMNGESSYRIAKTDRLDVGRLAPGNYTVALVVPENCTVSGGAPAVEVVAGVIDTVPAFEIACTPAVRSPRIAFVVMDTVNGSTGWTIESIRLDGSDLVRVTHGDTPAWSADGTKLIFSTNSCEAGGYWDYGYECIGNLAVMDPEIGNHAVLSGPAVYGFRPAWAPTGDAIVFEFRDYFDSPARLAMMRTTDSSTVDLVVRAPQLSSLEQAAWSPDGARLAVTCTWLSNADLCLINRDGSGLVRLTSDALKDGDPAWSPDGKTIAFTRQGADPSNPASTDVALLDLATNAITLLTQGSDPTWSPDGSRLAFVGSDGLFIVNADGTNRTRLTSGSHSAPAWRP